MAWFVQHHPYDAENVLHAFDTEAQAETWAHWLVEGRRIKQVVIYEADSETSHQGDHS